MIRDHQGSVIKTCSKPVGGGFAIEVEVVVLLEGLVQGKTLGLSNFVVLGGFVIVISWPTKKERGSWRLGTLLY